MSVHCVRVVLVLFVAGGAGELKEVTVFLWLDASVVWTVERGHRCSWLDASGVMLVVAFFQLPLFMRVQERRGRRQTPPCAAVDFVLAFRVAAGSR